MNIETEHKSDGQVSAGTVEKKRDSLSMHADVPVWCDCCTCEAEPYWVEAFRDEDTDNEVNDP
jgi:hypothetical protein